MHNVNYLVVFYPHRALWRKFHLRLDKKAFPLIDAGVYLRNGRNIYVVGGASIRYKTTKDPKNDFYFGKRLVEPLFGCIRISIPKINTEKLRMTLFSQEKKIIQEEDLHELTA